MTRNSRLINRIRPFTGSGALRRIGLNLLYLVPGETGGTEIYARQLLPALLAARPDLDFTVFANREAYDDLKTEEWSRQVELVRVPTTGRSRAIRVAAEQLLLPRFSRLRRLDVLHSLGTTGPTIVGAANVVTVHDLIYKHIPEAHWGAARVGMKVLVPLACRSADRLIAVSEATKKDLAEHLGVDPNKVDVIYEGCGADPVKPSEPSELRERLELGNGSIALSVSAKRPHKNLQRLIAALARLPENLRPTLVLPGYATPHEDELKSYAAELGVSESVKFFGWLSNPDLEGLYELSSFFVFPSLYEGFGLPVLEAMRRGVPVACSNTSSLPEIAGDAARTFNPGSVDEIAAAMKDLLQNDKLAADLAVAGRERSRQFTWDKAAAETIATYERSISPKAKIH